MDIKKISINIESSIFSNEEIRKIEKHYKAKYICDSQLINKKGESSSSPFAFFYTDIPHPRGSNYFALYFDDFSGKLMITNGKCILDQEITGILIDDVVYFSRYRHDFVKKGKYSIDGGRDYCKLGFESTPPIQVNLKVNKDRLEIYNAEL